MQRSVLRSASLVGFRKKMFASGMLLPLSAFAADPGIPAGGLTTGNSVLAMENQSSAEPSQDDPKAKKKKDATELSPMVVSGSENPLPVYQVDTSTAGTKSPIEITRVPQSIQVITDDAFKDQGAQSIGDIMKRVPSATMQGSRFTRFPSVNIRGFQAGQTRNGIRQLFFDGVDFSALSHIQSVEILKGPGSNLYGQVGEGGGVINVVTKRPYDDFGAEVSFTRGGWTGFDGDITTGQWDFNAPLTPDGALKMRFTGEVEGSDSFIDFQELNRENFGLMLSYDDGGPVRAYINAEYQYRETLPNPALPPIGTVQSSGGLGRISRDTFLGEPKFDRLTSEAPLVQAWVEFDVLDNWNDVLKNWKVIPRYQYQEFNVKQNQMFLGDASPNAESGSIDVARSGRTDFVEEDRMHIVQLDITGTLETGPLSHQIYLGGEYQKNFADPLSQFRRVNVPSINALNPTFLNTAPEIDPNRVFFGGGRGPDVEVWAFSFQDFVSITPYFDLMGGVRQTNVTSRAFDPANPDIDVDNTSFQVGGTFHVTDSVHLFAGYGEGFDVNSVGDVGADGTALLPGESEQVEAGIKVNFPWGLTGTASFFEITRTNVSTTDRLNPGFSVQTGEIRHRGAEVELAYQVTDQWYIQGGYVFIDSEITKSNDGDQGNRFQNTPEHQANIWTHYRFDSGPLRNLTLSTGVNFVGDRPLDNANTVELPNFTTWDLGASYTFDKVRPFKDVKLELFANNILDKRYFTAADFGRTVFPGDPRSIVGRISLTY